MESPKKESPKNFQPTPKPATDQALQGGNVVVPGTASNSPQTGTDKTKGNTAETAAGKNGKGNTASPPPKEVVGALKSDPVHK